MAPVSGKSLTYSALCLNADFRPMSYFPLSTMPWQDAVVAVVKGNVSVVAEYDKVIRSPSIEMKLPSVIAVREFVKMRQRVAFTRFNVFLRDDFTCQYCSTKFPTSELTFEHVTPRLKGGETKWDNIVAACDPCNLRKGHGDHMKPLRMPYEPTAEQLMRLKRKLPQNFLHETWQDFLSDGYWNVELEP